MLPQQQFLFSNLRAVFGAAGWKMGEINGIKITLSTFDV
jgi:hypothetical protein